MTAGIENVELNPLEPSFYQRVMNKLRQRLQAENLDGILLLDTYNVIYTTGFFHAANERPVGVYVPVEGEITLFVPLLEKENAEATWIKNIQTYEEFPGVHHPILWMVKRCGATQLALDTLEAALYPQASSLVKHLVLSDMVARQRFVKEPEELVLIREAAKIADACLDYLYTHASDILKNGGTELELLNESVKAARTFQKERIGEAFAHTKNGVTGTVHTGPRAALPHGTTLPRKPQPGDTLIAGIGASVGGYHAESGITLVIGEMNRDQRHCLEAAQNCNDAAVAALRLGVSCQAVNKAAWDVLEAADLKPFIRHRIGHGMGIQGHEAPWLAPGDETPIEVGMVFSNEPGIYRPNVDGYRIINTMIVTEHGVEIPSTFQARHPLDTRMISL